MEQFVLFFGADDLHWVGFHCLCFMASVFIPSLSSFQVPLVLSHRGYARHACQWPSPFLAVDPTWDPLHSLAWTPHRGRALIDRAFTAHYKPCGSARYPSLSTLNLLPASSSQPSCCRFAWLSSLPWLGCILFLILVAPDISSCQLVAPLSQSKEARAEQQFGKSQAGCV